MNQAQRSHDYAARRRRLATTMGPRAVTIVANPGAILMQGTGTVARRSTLDPSPNAIYLTGIDEEDVVAVISSTAPDQPALFVRPADPIAETWSGARMGLAGAARVAGLGDAAQVYPLSLGELERRLPDLLLGADTLVHDLGSIPALDQVVLHAISVARRSWRKGLAAPDRIVHPESCMGRLRAIKEPSELESMRTAIQITNDALCRGAALCHAGNSEADVKAAITHEFTSRGASFAFPPIVAGGANAACLHHEGKVPAPLSPDSLLLMDIGAKVGWYCADITRTVPVGGRFTPQQRQMYQVVLDAQRAAMEIIRPGVTLVEVHQRAVDKLKEGMVRLGLISNDRKDWLIPEDNWQQFYPHWTSHFIGLEAHDSTRAIDRDGFSKLLPGMVITVEPGLYISSLLGPLPDSWFESGIRIEDMVLVTHQGHEVLSDFIPREPDEVEALVRQGK